MDSGEVLLVRCLSHGLSLCCAGTVVAINSGDRAAVLLTGCLSSSKSVCMCSLLLPSSLVRIFWFVGEVVVCFFSFSLTVLGKSLPVRLYT